MLLYILYIESVLIEKETLKQEFDPVLSIDVKRNTASDLPVCQTAKYCISWLVSDLISLETLAVTIYIVTIEG